MSLSSYVARIEFALAQPSLSPEDRFDIIERALMALDNFKGDTSALRTHFLQLRADLSTLIDFDPDALYEEYEDEHTSRAYTHDAALSRSLAHL